MLLRTFSFFFWCGQQGEREKARERMRGECQRKKRLDWNVEWLLLKSGENESGEGEVSKT